MIQVRDGRGGAQPERPIGAGSPERSERSERVARRSRNRTLDREILRLAVPAFLALVAEPLFLLSDAAVVGHLGTPELAALGIASAVLGTLVSLCIFLAYGTTASVARQVGAGNTRDALAQGVDGLWLAVVIGGILTAVALPSTNAMVQFFEPGEHVADLAVIYLRIALVGVVPLLLMLAATGVLRGLQDTRTPLVVAVVGNLANIGLNVALVYGAGLGIAGSALGTLVAQLGSALALVWVVVRAARRESASLRPDLPGIRQAGRAGVPLIMRTLMLRVSLLVMTYAAARLGSDELATMQLALTIWTFLVFTLDAVAIAAQAITGRYLGASDAAGTRAVTTRMEWWGWLSGVVTGLGLAAASPVLGRLFTSDPAVLDLLVPVLIVAALAQPLAGIVFVLDGVLIGAGDAVYLAWAQLVTLVLFAPAAWLVSDRGLTWLWAVFALFFMGGRAVTLILRARGDRWMRLGA